MLYFAYGADLSSHAVLDFCRQHRCPVPRRSAIRPAVLPNYRIQFTQFDSYWNGGVADVICEVGKSVSGALMEVSNLGMETLRRMNGARKRVDAKVTLFSGGTPIDAVMFVDGQSEHAHIPPTNEYLEHLMNAAVQLGLSTMWIMQLRTFAAVKIKRNVWPLQREFASTSRLSRLRERSIIRSVRPSIELDDMPELVQC